MIKLYGKFELSVHFAQKPGDEKMIEEFGIDDNKIFKVVVAATMSSGKSTFINALLGKELLLSRNEACSAQIISVLDNDITVKEKIFLKYNNKKTEIHNTVDRNLMEKINQSTDIDKVLIETEVPGIRNTDRAMLIIDTPGVNNSMDISHKEKTMNFLKEFDEGLIIYLINATQIGIDDDYNFLRKISNDVSESNGKKRIIFIVNRMDELDEEKESITDCINNIHEYLLEAGIVNPQIYPVSSLACKLFRMAMNGSVFTRRENADFDNLYSTFRMCGHNLNKYIISDDYIDKDKIVSVRGTEYRYADLYMAVENTGIPAVEHAIEDIMSECGEVFTPEVSINAKRRANAGDVPEFELKNSLIVKCPAGNKPISSGLKNGEIVARFKRGQCVNCELSQICGIDIRPRSAIKIIKRGVKKNGSSKKSKQK